MDHDAAELEALRQRVRELQSRTEAKAAQPSPPPPPWVREMEHRIRTHLGAKVRVRNHEGYRGEIVIEYHGRDDLDRLYGALAPKKSL